MRLSTLVLFSLSVGLGWTLRDLTFPRSTALASRSIKPVMVPTAPEPIVVGLGPPIAEAFPAEDSFEVVVSQPIADAAAREEPSDVEFTPDDPAIIDWLNARARIIARLSDDTLRAAS